MVKKIKLTRGKFALVDDEDYERLNKYKWHVNESRNLYYAMRSQAVEVVNGEQKRKGVKMHRLIMEHKLGRELKEEELIDHINHNTLDNTRQNLRITSVRQNNQNKIRKNGSKFCGVHLNKTTGKWGAEFVINHKTMRLGYFDNELSAAKAYEMSCRLYSKENLICKIDKKPSYKISNKFTPIWEVRKDRKTSKYKGVSLHPSTKKWRVRKTVNGKCIYFGSFDSEEEAHQARLEADEKYDV